MDGVAHAQGPLIHIKNGFNGSAEPQHHRQHQNFMLAALYNPHPAAAPHSALFSGQQSVQTQNFLGGSHHELFTGANGGTARFSLSGQSVTPRTSIGPPRLATLPTAGQNPNQQHLFASTGNSNVKPVDFSGIPDVFGFSQSFPLQNQQSQSHHQGLFTHNSISSGIQSGVVTSTVSYRQHPNMHIEQPTTTPSLFGTPRLSTASHTSYQPAILTNPGAQQPSLSQHALLSSFNPSLTSTSAAAIYENPQMSGIVAESLAHLSQPELQNVILHMSKHGPLDASCLQQRIHLFSGSPMTPQQSLFPLEPISSFHGNPNSQVGNSRRPVSGYQHTCRQQMTPPSMPSGSTPVKYHKPLASAASSADTQHQSLQGGTETKTPVVEGPTHHTQMNSSQQILSRSSTASPSAACTAPIPSSLSTTTPLTSSE